MLTHRARKIGSAPGLRALRVFLLIAAVALPLAAAGPVAAGSRAVETHCVEQVVGETPAGQFLTESLGCYGSFAKAVAVASGGTVDLAPETSGTAALTDPEVAGVLSTFTLGIHYDGYNGTGSSITITGSNCSGGYWNTSSWWDNRISSSYNGCQRLIHYDFPNLGGGAQHTVGAGAIHNLTLFSNRTESVQYLSS